MHRNLPPSARFLLLGGVLILAVTLAAALPLLAQQPPPGQQGQQGEKPAQPPAQQPGQAAPAAPQPPPVDPAEEAAYKVIAETKEPERQIQLAEQFLKDYPQSRYRENIYSKLTHAYLSTGEMDKMLAASEQALALNPNDVDVLAVVGWTLPRRLGNNTLDAQQKLAKADQYCTHALELISALPKPETLTEEQFQMARNEKSAMCHSGLGLVKIHRGQYADAITELKQATTLTTQPEMTDFYLLGFAYMNSKQPHAALEPLEKCSTTPGELQPRCKALLDSAKKQAENTLAPPGL